MITIKLVVFNISFGCSKFGITPGGGGLALTAIVDILAK